QGDTINWHGSRPGHYHDERPAAVYSYSRVSGVAAKIRADLIEFGQQLPVERRPVLAIREGERSPERAHPVVLRRTVPGPEFGPQVPSHFLVPNEPSGKCFPLGRSGQPG